MTIWWSIWRTRNAEIFSDQVWNDWYLLNYIRTLHDSIVKAYGPMYSTQTIREVKWNPPPENYIKLNVDGSSFGNPGRSSFGGIFRNSYGEWMWGFSGFCGISTNLNVELLAIYHGLDMAWKAGYKFVICESDSLSALSLINDGVSPFHPFAPLIEEIHMLRCMQRTLSCFKHILREGNEFADWMAKIGASLDHDLQVWEDCPPQLQSVILADVLGVVRLRT